MIATMMLGIIELFVILFVLGGGGLVLFLVVFGIAKNRPGLAALAGGLLFLGLLAPVFLGMLFVGTRATSVNRNVSTYPAGETIVDREMNTTLNYIGDEVGVYEPISDPMPRPIWNFSLFPLLLIGGAMVALIVLAMKRWSPNHAASGRRRAWPALVVVGLFFLYMFGSVRFQRASPENVHDGIEAMQQVVQMDIHHLMDKADAPKVLLASEPTGTPPEPPPSPPAPAAPQAIEANNAEPAAPSDGPASESEAEKPKDNALSEEAETKAELDSEMDAKKSEEPTSKPERAAEKPSKKIKPRPEPTPSKKSTSEAAPLVAAKSQPPRPDWIDDPPKRTGDTQREVINTDAYATADECYRAADVFLLLKTYQRLQELVGQPYVESSLPSLSFQGDIILADGTVIAKGKQLHGWADHRLHVLQEMGVGIDYVRRELVAKDSDNHESREYLDTVERSFGPMKQLYMQIEFTPAIDKDLRRRWENHEREQRFWMVGGGASCVLAMLGSLFGLLKIDTWTKGYYTMWLFLGIPAAIIGGSSLLFMLLTFA